MTTWKGRGTAQLGGAALCIAFIAGCVSAPPRPSATLRRRSAPHGRCRPPAPAATATPARWSSRSTCAMWWSRASPYHRFDAGGGASLMNDSVAMFMVLGPGDRPLMRYDPPLGYDFPLEVGKTWTQDITLTVGGTTKVPMKANWTVEADEDVTVPAGTFKAWRVSFTDNFGLSRPPGRCPTRWAPMPSASTNARRRTARGAGTQVIELLTLPAVKSSAQPCRHAAVRPAAAAGVAVEANGTPTRATAGRCQQDQLSSSMRVAR